MGSRRVLGAVLGVGLSCAGLATVTATGAAGAGSAACDAVAWRGSDGTTGQVYAADADGTARVEVSTADDSASDPTSNFIPVWSPDGTQIAWRGLDGTTYQIFVAGADGTGRTAMSPIDDSTTDPTNNWDPVWSPDGTQIAWYGYWNSINHIHAADADGTNRVRVSTVDDSSTDPSGNLVPVWSPDGSQIAWRGYDSTGNQVFVADADGTNRFAISTVDDSTPDPTGNYDLDWSPDGTQIAWRGYDSTYQIYVADADGTNRVEVSTADDSASDPTDNWYQAWSPDGTQIAWRGEAGAERQIYVADADGTNRVEVSTVDDSSTDPTGNFIPVWSPDGSQIAWQGKDSTTDFQVYVADADGTNRVEVSTADDSASDPTDNWYPVWSPGGAQIAWRGYDGTTNQVYVADADGTSRSGISTVDNTTTDPTGNTFPRWRPRVGLVMLGSTVDNLVVGEVATVTVTASTDCPASGVEISGLEIPCLSSVTRLTSDGTLSAAGVWSIDSLDGTATAIITGVVGDSDCNANAVVSRSYPGEATSTRIGLITPNCENTHPFVDIGGLSYGEADIACIYGRGITTGTTGTTYSPFDDVSRQQMGAFLARLWRDLGGVCDSTLPPFTDTTSLSYGEADIACIYNLGITTGTTSTTYSPFDDVTRQQMGAFLARLWRALGAVCDSTLPPFTDTTSLSYGEADIACIYNLGITTGTSTTTYSPADNVTRQQMGAFLARLWRAAVAAGYWN